MAEYIEREAVQQVLYGIANGLSVGEAEALKTKDIKALYKIKGAKEILNSVDNDLCFVPSADVQPVNQWISVEDRLPDDDGWYLVYKFKQVRVAEWCESCWYNERDLPIDDVAISHWIPLPEPPNKT